MSRINSTIEPNKEFSEEVISRLKNLQPIDTSQKKRTINLFEELSIDVI